MLRTDKLIYKVLFVLNLILIVLGVALCATNIARVTDNVTRLLMNIFFIIAIIFAAIYVIYGYRKNAARYYRYFIGSFAVAMIVTIINTCKNTSEVFLPLIFALMLCIIVASAFGENFGKIKSFIYCGILILFALAALFLILPKNESYSLVAGVVLVDLTLIFSTMTYAKYLDKTERGTK